MFWRQSPRGLKPSPRGLKLDERGVSAVEFALIAPLMMLLLWGAIAFSSSFTLVRRVSTMASTAADLVARCNDVNDQDLDDIIGAASLILSPFTVQSNNANVDVQFVSASKDGGGNVVVDWSYPGSATTAGIDPNLIDANSSVIRATVTYTSVDGSIQKILETISVPGFNTITSPTVYTENFYAKPRRSLKVNYTPAGEDCPEDP